MESASGEFDVYGRERAKTSNETTEEIRKPIIRGQTAKAGSSNVVVLKTER